MSINRYDTYQPFEYPIEAMLKMGQIAEQRSDRGNDAMDKFQAALSSVTPAPGHEDYAKEVVGKYYTQAQELVNSGIRPEDPRFLGGLRKMTYQLANDPDIKNIQTSKKYYDEIIAKTLPEVINKAGIAEMEGVLQNNNFIPNRRNYNNFRYYTGDYVAEADADLAKVAEQIDKTPWKYGATEDPNLPGHWVIKEGSVTRKWRDSNTFKKTIASMAGDWLERKDANPGRQRYFKEFGADPARLLDFFNDRAEKFMMEQKTVDANYQFLSKGNNDGKGSKDPLNEVELMESPVQINEYDYDQYLDANSVKQRYKKESQYGLTGAGTEVIKKDKLIADGPPRYDYSGLSKKQQETFQDLLNEVKEEYPNLSDSKQREMVNHKFNELKTRETKGLYWGYRNPQRRKEEASFVEDNMGTFWVLDNKGNPVRLNAFIQELPEKDRTFTISGEYQNTNGFTNQILNNNPKNVEMAMLFTSPKVITFGNGVSRPVSSTIGSGQTPVIVGNIGTLPKKHYDYLINTFSNAERTGLLTHIPEGALGEAKNASVKYKDGKYTVKYDWKGTVYSTTSESLDGILEGILRPKK